MEKKKEERDGREGGGGRERRKRIEAIRETYMASIYGGAREVNQMVWSKMESF